MADSAATREAIRRLDGWTVALWLTAPQPYAKRGPDQHRPGAAKYQDTGPMRGLVRLAADPAAEWFLFCRPGRASVRVAFGQVVMWQEISGPRLPAEEAAR